MMSLKVLAVLALVAVCAGDPLLLHKQTALSKPATVEKSSSGLLVSVGFLFRGLSEDVKVKDRNALKTIFGLKLPTNLEDTFRFGIALVRGIGAVLDHFIVGFGNLLTRIVAAAIKIIVCILGTVGSKNSFICKSSFDEQFGVHGAPRDASDVCRQYRVQHADTQVYSHIKKYTKGKGPKSVKGSREEIFRISVDLAKLLVNLQAGKSQKKDILILYEKLTIGVGALGESYSVGLGVSLADDIFSAFVGIFKKNGIGEFPQDYQQSKKTIQRCGKDSAPWPKYHYRANKNRDRRTSLPRGLKYLFTGIKNKVQLDDNILSSITSLDVPKTLNDLVVFVPTVTHGLAVAINKYVPKLGSLVNRIIAATLKIIFCINLSFGHGTWGSLCDSSFDRRYGAPGDAADADDVCDDYKVQHADTQLKQLLDHYSGGKGLKSLDDPIKLIFQTSLDLVVILKKKESLNKKDFSSIFVKLSICTGALGEGYLKDFGAELITSIFDSCNQIFLRQGINISKQKQSAINAVKYCNERSPWGWSYPQDYQASQATADDGGDVDNHDDDDDDDDGGDVDNHDDDDDDDDGDDGDDGDDDDDGDDGDDDDDGDDGDDGDDETSDDSQTAHDSNGNDDDGDDKNGCDGTKDDDWTGYDRTEKAKVEVTAQLGDVLLN